MMKKHNQQGFTLIELMIVIAIIGILASVAIPQYQVYTQRTEATTSIANVRTLQVAIQEHFSTTGDLPGDVASLKRFGIASADIDKLDDNSAAIKSVGMSEDGAAQITITYDSKANGAPADLATKTMIITPAVSSGVIVFGFVDGASGSIDDKFLPNLPTVTVAAAD
jgi:type IV pilus assembly protein PilA